MASWDVESWADGYLDGMQDSQAEVARLHGRIAQLRAALEQAPHPDTTISYSYARWYREVRAPALDPVTETVTT